MPKTNCGLSKIPPSKSPICNPFNRSFESGFFYQFFQEPFFLFHGRVESGDPMIHYVEKLPSGNLLLVSTARKEECTSTFSALFTKWTQKRLSTWEGRILATKRQFSLSSKVPLYCEEGLLLMPIRGMRSPNALFINYYAVCSWKADSSGTAEIRFPNHAVLQAGSAVGFRKRMREARSIDEFLRQRDST